VDDVVWFLAAVTASAAAFWAESWVARGKLRRDLLRQGWALSRARWRGPYLRVFSRQVPFVIEIERTDRTRRAGIAYVGGRWVGALFSGQIEYEWTDDDG
jgi:hypothetical protein